jgi:hypothetical protein
LFFREGAPLTTAQEILRRHNIAYVNTKSGKYTTNCPDCGQGYLNVKTDSKGVQWFCQYCDRGDGEYFDKRANGKANKANKADLGPIKDTTTPMRTTIYCFKHCALSPLMGRRCFASAPDRIRNGGASKASGACCIACAS